jgi:SAM-dependent methyltransferase
MRADPPVGDVDLGDLGRIRPIDRAFGIHRGGRPVDRAYIEEFLAGHADDIRGHVLEVAEDRYASGVGADAVTRVDVLMVEEGHGAAIVGDLCVPETLPRDAYDCFVCTQTLQFVRDPVAAAASLHRLLASGGTLLLTVPGISQLSRYDADRWGDRWRFTACSIRELLEPHFGEVEVTARGNVLTAVALLHGLVVEDLPGGALGTDDPDYEVIVTARAVKS